MPNPIHELRDAFLSRLGQRLRDTVSTPEEANALSVDRWVELVTETFRELGKQRGLDVFPVKKRMGELGWEQCWGKNLAPSYDALGRAEPADLFRLELVLEISEGSLRPDSRGETAVEEAANDLGRLIWTRAPLKVLVFGARRAKESAASLEALDAGLSGVIAARDKDSSYLLVAFPNLEERRLVAPEKAAIWVRPFVQGNGETPVEKTIASLLR